MNDEDQEPIDPHGVLSAAGQQALTAALDGAASVANALDQLHRFEVLVADRFEWPWLRWPRWVKGRADLADVVGAALQPSEQGAGLDSKIIENALALRCAGAGDGVIGDGVANELFAKPMAVAQQAKALPYGLVLELLFCAYKEKRWRVVRSLAEYLLDSADNPHEADARGRLNDLLLEALFFAVYRPGMADYVDNPKPLLAALKSAVSGRTGGEISAAKLRCEANLLAMTGDFAKAIEIYEQANDVSGFRVPVFEQAETLLDVGQLLKSDRASVASWIKAHSSISHHFRHDPHGETAILVGCERAYFERYGEAFIHILGLREPGALVHFQLINMPEGVDEISALLDRWQAAYGVRINFSLEQNKVLADLPHARAGVCVASRYIYLSGYLEAYEAVLVSDIDGWFEVPLKNQGEARQKDVLINSWVWRKNTGYWRLPWGSMAGGYLLVQSSAAGRRYADLVGYYLKTVLMNNAYAGKPLFFADQAAIFLCLQHMIGENAIELGFLRGKFEQSADHRIGERQHRKVGIMTEKIAQLKIAAGQMPDAPDDIKQS